MAETELTKAIKRVLLHHTKADCSGIYGCYEVCLGAGYGDEYVDYMTMSSTNVFRAYEIKVSLSDLKSKAKLSFCGDYNYIVLPEELYQKEAVKEELKYHTICGIGILLYCDRLGCKYIKQERKPGKMTLNVGRRVELMHYMIRSLSRYTVKFVKVGNK